VDPSEIAEMRSVRAYFRTVKSMLPPRRLPRIQVMVLRSEW
jgi:hypothetical protein